MPIENRNLEPGTKLVASYKKETCHALVLASAEGKGLYQLSPSDGKKYKSPSSLGTAVTGKTCNGWAFWSVDTSAAEDTTEPPATSETEPEQTGPDQAPDLPLEEDSPEPPPGAFRRVPDQRGVDEGQVRLYCDTCHNSFIVPEDQNPETCPMGHEPV